MSAARTPAILSLPTPKTLAVPLTATAQLQTTAGQYIIAGQTLATDKDADICAPANGIVGEPKLLPLATPNAETALCLPIITDTQKTPLPQNTAATRAAEDKKSFIHPGDSPAAMLKKFGIVGLGGAGVAAKRKYRPNAGLIINALESDETITCDRALLAAAAPHITAHAAAVAAFLGATDTIIAVRDDSLPIAETAGVQVRRLKTDYALGAERMLIHRLYQLSPPPDTPPADYGALCFNLGTCLAMAEMLINQTPMTTRVLTVRNADIVLNIRAPFGASLADIAAFANISNLSRIHIGGRESQIPALAHAVICAKTNLADFAPAAAKTALPCIRCGDCLPVCPQHLSPLNLFALWQDREITRMQNQESLQACILCRRCDEVCPSDIPLAAAFAAARQQWQRMQDEQQTVTRRRMRYQHHLHRLSQPPRFAELHPAELAARARQRAEKTKNTDK